MNIAGSVVGVPSIYMSASSTTMAYSLGGIGRLVPLSAMGVLALFVAFLPQLLGAIPIFVTSGLVLQLGLLFVQRWLIKPAVATSLWDRVLGVAIVAVSFSFGIASAVAFGFVAAALIFAVTYARLPVVGRSTTLAETRSSVDRSPKETHILDAEGSRVTVDSVQGFLFFGSITRLVRIVRERLSQNRNGHTVVLDFSAVSGIDVTAIEALRKLDFLAEGINGTIVIAGCPPSVHKLLEKTIYSHQATDLAITRRWTPLWKRPRIRYYYSSPRSRTQPTRPKRRYLGLSRIRQKWTIYLP